MFYLFGGQNEPEKLTADASKTRGGGKRLRRLESEGEEGGVNNGRQFTVSGLV